MLEPAKGKENRYWAMFKVNGSGRFREVPKAYPVRIEAFDDLELFSYRAWLEDAPDKGQWYVAEATSGLSVSAPSGTEMQAVQSAISLLFGYGAAETKRRIESSIKKYGLSPRYLEGTA
jgi:hypothetical protein